MIDEIHLSSHKFHQSSVTKQIANLNHLRPKKLPATYHHSVVEITESFCLPSPPSPVRSCRQMEKQEFYKVEFELSVGLLGDLAVYLYASDNNIARGGPEFLSFAKLKDPKQGFLLDDTLINEAEATLLGLVLRGGDGEWGLLRTAVVLGILRRKVWVAPQMGAFKINVDAAMRLGNGRYGSMVQVR
ncbi:hypothetical protein Q3G72_017957 [Acer saccharum]|nr:hypothetical protein Q3G72_017957 [Acer saccharum]